MIQNDIKSEKTRLRKELKEKRAYLRKEFPESDSLIFEKIKREQLFLAAECIFCYVSYGTETKTDKIIEEILKLGKTLVVPKCTDENGTMIAVRINSTDELKDGMYGIKEPVSNNPFDKERIDLAIIPGLAFDKNGFRLGYGKGYYDRFLSGSKIKTIGICPKELLLETVPHLNSDIAVTKVITN